MRIPSLLVYAFALPTLAHGDFLRDVPKPNKGCMLCDGEQVLNIDVEHRVDGKTCQEINQEAVEIHLEATENFLSPCKKIKQQYQSVCCSGGSSMLQDGDSDESQEDNLFGHPLFPSIQGDDTESSSEMPPVDEPVIESITNPNLFGVMREDPWSRATTLRSNGCITALATTLVILVHTIVT